MVDFKGKLGKKEPERKTDPIEIYNDLDRSSATGPLRPSQEVILKAWYNSFREQRDLIIKLHTGEGKTLIGLLILHSRLNSKSGPCLYVCPNNYLVQQVCAEATKFGIPHCYFGPSGEFPEEFANGTKILITSVQKVFNGRTIFGLGNKFQEVSNIILDDSHACIDSIKSAFTIRVDKEHAAFQELINLFNSELSKQGEGTWLDICNEDYDSMLPVPYWAWAEQRNEVLEILRKNKDENWVKFVWPLIKDDLRNYQMFVSGSRIEISPYLSPIHVFNSFSKAKQRILMSATTQDDSFFIRGLGFEVDAVRNPLTNNGKVWSGEKMIILPSLINDELDRTRIVNAFAPPSEKRNVGIVVLVPSFPASEYYRQLGAKVASAASIFKDVTALKENDRKQTLVIANRYDGIDLPDSACRVLIIDSLPYSDSLADRYEEMCRVNSEILGIKVAQKIEQGLGRSVRGEKDYSAILLVGKDLVRFVKSPKTNRLFSQQTRKQIEIGLETAKEAGKEVKPGSEINVVKELINQCLARDKGWKDYYTQEMDAISKDAPNERLYNLIKLERDAELEFYNGRPDAAYKIIQQIVDLFPNDPEHREERGWYLQIAARYKYYQSKTESAHLQAAAFSANSEMLQPINGVVYTRMEYIHGERIKRIKEYFNKFKSHQDLYIEVDGILNGLSFGQRSEIFERSLHEVGIILGYVCQRPDKEIKKGPDNLWGGVSDKYVLFECKSEVKEDREAITKHEANQMSGHIAWFEKEYENSPSLNIMIIETKNLSYQGDFVKEVLIMRKGNLKKFVQRVLGFIKEFSRYDIHKLSDEAIQKALEVNKLLPDDLEELTEEVHHQTKVVKK